jgi:hypothetical protein
MSRSANVLSVQALKDFKVVMCNFAEEARNSLSGVDMELRRTRDWLERDQLGFWMAQVKRRQEAVAEARTALHRRKLSQQGSDAVSDAEQKEALREAQRRLAVAEEKVAIVKKLIPFLQHAIDEYHSHSQPLSDHLTGGFEKSVFALEKMISSLEAYLALKAPSAPQYGSAVETGASPSSTGASMTGQTTAAPVESPVSDTATTEHEKSPDNAESSSPTDEKLVAGRVS